MPTYETFGRLENAFRGSICEVIVFGGNRLFPAKAGRSRASLECSKAVTRKHHGLYGPAAWCFMRASRDLSSAAILDVVILVNLVDPFTFGPPE